MNTEEHLSTLWNLGNVWQRRHVPIDVPNVNREDLAIVFGKLGFKSGAEIGVEKGLYSEVLCKAMPGLHLYAIDKWQTYPGYREHVTAEHYDSLKVKAEQRLASFNVTFIQDWSVEASTRVPDGSLDFVYIDGNHSLPYVIADLAAWIPKVREGGVVSGHDYSDRLLGHARPERLHVIEAVHAWTHAYGIYPWFVLGSDNPKPGERRDKNRSWLWVKRA